MALWAGFACVLGQWVQPGLNDWRYFWTAGAAVWQGRNPYDAVAALGSYPLFYPGPAVLILAPFGLLPVELGWLAFAVVSGLVFGLAARKHPALWVGALSAPFFEAILYGQWSPLLVGAAVVPALGGLLAAKPTIGLALFAWRADRRTAVSALALVAVSLLILPSWPHHWVESLRSSNHVAPVMRPFGWLLLTAWIKWRTPEGRLLGTLSVIPQTTGLYESLPLFLVLRSRWEGYALACSSLLSAALAAALFPQAVPVSVGTAQRWPLVFGLLWLPALLSVLRPERGRQAGWGE